MSSPVLDASIKPGLTCPDILDQRASLSHKTFKEIHLHKLKLNDKPVFAIGYRSFKEFIAAIRLYWRSKLQVPLRLTVDYRNDIYSFLLTQSAGVYIILDLFTKEAREKLMRSSSSLALKVLAVILGDIYDELLESWSQRPGVPPNKLFAAAQNASANEYTEQNLRFHERLNLWYQAFDKASPELRHYALCLYNEAGILLFTPVLPYSRETSTSVATTGNDLVSAGNNANQNHELDATSHTKKQRMSGQPLIRSDITTVWTVGTSDRKTSIVAPSPNLDSPQEAHMGTQKAPETGESRQELATDRAAFPTNVRPFRRFLREPNRQQHELKMKIKRGQSQRQ